MRVCGNAIVVALTACAATQDGVAAGDAPVAPRSTFTTLGTNAGPIPNRTRAEPANLLKYGNQVILVDAGDAAAMQLDKAGVALGQLQTIFISHLHFDHTGGLFALLSMRYQGINPGIVTIYGPPGTRRTVDGLVAAMMPMTEGAGRMGAVVRSTPDNVVSVIELTDGSKVALGPIVVTAAANTHLIEQGQTEESTVSPSLSYRFDLPDRSIVYTGDTGPSARVERLAKDADLLICEIIDPDATMAALRQSRPDVPAAAMAIVDYHMRRQHLSPVDVGQMAKRSGAKALVITHNSLWREALPDARRQIAGQYQGPVSFAEDMASF
jgi:ribonuclease BN (tRNA processing enzyme)